MNTEMKLAIETSVVPSVIRGKQLLGILESVAPGAKQRHEYHKELLLRLLKERQTRR